MIYRPPFTFNVSNGSIQSHYLNMPTGVLIEIEGKPRARQPLQFIDALARIIDDSDDYFNALRS